MKKRILPTIDDILFAISEDPLGMGDEAKVYRVHTMPKYTVRVSNEAPTLEVLAGRIYNEPFIQQKDIFAGRNYGQAVAYLPDHPGGHDALVTINLYVPGFSMEIHKPGREPPSSEEALMKTIALSKAVLNMPDDAIDRLFDDLHFLSSREQSIDVDHGGLFTNMGNILYSGVDKEFRIIDIQPFLREHVGIPTNHTKGFNTPYFLLNGLVPGAYKYAEEHAKYPPLIEYRTEIVDKVINSARRNNLNDVGGYLPGDASKMAVYWKNKLSKLQIDEKYIESFVKDVTSIKQKQRYRLVKSHVPLIRVVGNEM